MQEIKLTKRQEKSLARLREEFTKIKSEFEEIDFVLQGSVVERWKKCGKPACRCHKNPDEWHGPYHQWSWKSGGRTSSLSLSREQADLCREWVENNRRLEGIVKKLRSLSSRAVRIYGIRKNRKK
ncbi:MAG: hypothetical protein GY854_25525 [Deltaproteobacteria bacterium]|nr:hypothetical protein [Deltaproteobacteria bacterium]